MGKECKREERGRKCIEEEGDELYKREKERIKLIKVGGGEDWITW